jgi:hypothetical protein
VIFVFIGFTCILIFCIAYYSYCGCCFYCCKVCYCHKYQ